LVRFPQFRRRGHFTSLAGALILLSALACASSIEPRAAGQDAAPPAPVTADKADVVVTAFQEPTSVRVGQTIGVKPFRSGARWQVSFSNTALHLLTPADRLPAPGDEGWVWKALAPGPAEIVLTPVVACDAPPCPPNVLRVTIKLDIRAS
jgi:hypothetical protein